MGSAFRCSHGAEHCKGDYFDGLEAHRTVTEIRREAGRRMQRGQLCVTHARQLHALAPLPSPRAVKIA